LELYRSAPFVLPPPQSVSEESAALRLLIGRLEQELEVHMEQPLATLLSEE
jgi:hypothetical protein